MDAHGVAQAQGVKADFLLGALAGALAAKLVGGLGTDGLDALGQHQSCAAGGVDLLIVVDLHDLNLRVGKGLGSLLGKVHQQRHAHGHVARKEHRDLPGSLVNGGALFRGVAGGADDHRQLPRLGIVQERPHGAVEGKIDDDVRRALVLGQGVKLPFFRAGGELRAHRGGQGAAGGGFHQGQELLPHAPGGAVYDNLHGCHLRPSSPGGASLSGAPGGADPPWASRAGAGSPRRSPWQPWRP